MNVETEQAKLPYLMLINSVPYREWLQTKQLKENRIFTT